MKFKPKRKAKYDKNLKYDLFSKSVIIGFVEFLIFGFLLISSIVKLPYLSSIHAFSFGFLLGYYCYPLYIIILVIALLRIFNLNMKVQKKIDKYILVQNIKIFLFLFFIGLILMLENINSWILSKSQFVGANLWKLNFINWWKNFTNVSNPILPNFDICGVLILFLTTLTNFWTGFLLNTLVGLFLILLAFWYLLKGSPIQMIKQNNKIIQDERKDFKEHLDKVVNVKFEDNNPLINEKEMIKNQELMNPVKIETTKTEVFVFDEQLTMKQHQTIVDKTMPVDIQKEKTKDVFETTFLFSNTDTQNSAKDELESKNNVKYKKETKGGEDTTFVFDIDLD